MVAQFVGNLKYLAGEVPVLQFGDLARSPALVHGFTTRIGGVSEPPFHTLNLSYAVGDHRDRVDTNRHRSRAAVGLSGQPGPALRLEHGTTVMDADAPWANVTTADGVVTTRPGVELFMTFADCLPILLVDETAPALCLAHAGWRGAVAGVALSAWEAIRAKGARAQSTAAYLGPGVGGCCYEVDPKVVEAARCWPTAAQAAVHARDRATYLDLATYNRVLLEGLGLTVHESSVCTACHTDLLYSHRAEAGRTGRFGAYAALT